MYTIEGFYFETKEDVLKKVLDMSPKDSLISWGGSATLHEIGVFFIIRFIIKIPLLYFFYNRGDSTFTCEWYTN
jgi:hypothetical protein